MFAELKSGAGRGMSFCLEAIIEGGGSLHRGRARWSNYKNRRLRS
jgi:hypothetical protein